MRNVCRLEGEWSARGASRGADVSTLSAALRGLASELIGEMRKTALKNAGDGILVIEQTAAGANSVLARFGNWMDIAMATVKPSAPATFTATFGAVLMDVHSYFAFRRQGQVEEGIWRELFERELSAKVTILCQLLEELSSQ